MSKINWDDLLHKTESELMAIVGKIEHAAEDAAKAGEAFYKKHEAAIKKAICGNKSSISDQITKENVESVANSVGKALGKSADSSSNTKEGLIAIAVYALKQGLDKYCENYQG